MQVDTLYNCENCGEVSDILVVSTQLFYWKTCNAVGEDLPSEEQEYDGTGAWEERVSCGKCGGLLEVNGGQ